MRKLFVRSLAGAALIVGAGSAALAQGALDFSGAPLSGDLPLGHAPGDPTYDMPAGQRLISAFGERPVFSPDGTKVAFIGHSYGDAFEYDLKTREIRNLTAHMPNRGFLRVHYLNDGSFLLLGPHDPAKTMAETRDKRIEVFWLDRAATGPAVPLRITLFEGLATSRYSNRIAWTENVPKGADSKDVKGSLLKTAEVVVAGGTPRLADVREVSTITECRTEAQDFLPGDKGVTMPCYNFDPAFKGGARTQVMSIDLASGAVTKYPTPPELYGEIEGIFPDGRHSLVECSGDRSAGMDLCVLELKAAAPRYTRITQIMDYGRWKYGNPVVSPNGRMIAAQVGSADVVDVGMGLGIVLIDVPAGFPKPGS